jgi:predicted dehydrogenase
MEKIKVAVIGLGSIAQLVHLPNLSLIENVTVQSVAEIKKSRLNAVADKFNIQERYTDVNELLQNSDVDAVIIATPTSTHKELAITCMKAGKDILVEKPLARSYAEAKPIVEFARKHNRKVMVGLNLRYRTDAMLLKSILSSGEIGTPFYVKCGWIRRQSSAENWFTRKEESGGGVIIDLGISMLDLSLWLLNYPPVNSVSTQSYQHFTKTVEDTSISFIKCADNSLIDIETSWSLPLEKDCFHFTVYGTEGYAALNPFRIYKRINEDIIDLTPSQSDSSMNLFKRSYLNELKSFIGAVKGLNPLFSSGEEALSRMKVIEAMYKSSNLNKEIKLG